MERIGLFLVMTSLLAVLAGCASSEVSAGSVEKDWARTDPPAQTAEGQPAQAQPDR